MSDTRMFSYKLPTGQVRTEPRRRDQDDPRFAIVGTRDGKDWGLFRMTQSEEELVRTIKELLRTGQSAYVTQPERVDDGGPE